MALPKGYLIGVIATSIDYGTTNSGRNYAKFLIACKESLVSYNGNRKSHFYNCVAWGNTARYLIDYCQKGSRVFLEFQIITSVKNNEYGTKKFMDFVISSVLPLKNTQNNTTEPQKPADFYKSEFSQDSIEEAEGIDELFNLDWVGADNKQETPQQKKSPDPQQETPQQEKSPDPQQETPQQEKSPDPQQETPQQEKSEGQKFSEDSTPLIIIE